MEKAREDSQKSYTHDAAIFWCGLMMGGADAIPGVSGGTVALLLRIYKRLVTAISNVDGRFLLLIRSRQWRAAAEHIDLRFLLVLGVGVVVGLVVTLKIIGDLLESTYRPYVLGSFFGMIAASCFLVGRMATTQLREDQCANTLPPIGMGVVGAAVAFSIYWFTTFGESESAQGPPGYFRLFCCGAIAICAMILPGISGAMVLLLLGVYTHLSQTVKGAASGDDLQAAILTVLCFCSGCAIGLLAFSKVLKKLLSSFPALTMATMCGFMCGALPKLWPFDKQVGGDPEHPHFHPTMPEVNSPTVGVTIVVIAAVVFVFAVDWFAARHQTAAPAEPSPEA